MPEEKTKRVTFEVASDDSTPNVEINISQTDDVADGKLRLRVSITDDIDIVFYGKPEAVQKCFDAMWNHGIKTNRVLFTGLKDDALEALVAALQTIDPGMQWREVTQ